MRLLGLLAFLISVHAWAALAAEFVTTPATQSATQPAGDVHVVKKGSLKFEIKADGTFGPAEPFEVKLKPRAYSGSFTVISSARHGAPVKAGDVLLECETTEYAWAMQKAESELELARVNLRKAEADADLGAKADALAMRMQEDALKNAEEGLRWWESVDGPNMLKQADLSLKEVRDNVEYQQDEMDQLLKMYKSEELTSATRDIVLKRAERRLDNAKKVLGMQEGVHEKSRNYNYPVARQRVLDSLEQARQSLASLKVAQQQSAVARRAAVTNARIALEQAQKKFDELKADQGLFAITSPAAGLVWYATVPDRGPGGDEPPALKVGEKVGTNQVLMRLITPGRLALEISVSEAQSLWLKPGMKASVTPAAMPYMTYPAACGEPAIGTRGNPPAFGTFVPVVVANADPRLVPGMKGTVKIDAGRLDGVLLVPVGTVQNGSVTVRRQDGTPEKRDVVLGQSDGQMIEVRSGLVEGEQVLLNPSR